MTESTDLTTNCNGVYVYLVFFCFLLTMQIPVNTVIAMNTAIPTIIPIIAPTYNCYYEVNSLIINILL